MNQKDLYNNAYKKFTPEFLSVQNLSEINRYLKENSASLEEFINKLLNHLNLEHTTLSANCLELGCGLGSFSFELEKRFSSVTSVDVSDLAIAHAKTICAMKNSSVKFELSDAKTYQSDEKFDYIIDSHLLHCLTNDKERLDYLKNVAMLLKKNGKFFIETMAFNPEIKIPVNYGYDENRILYKDDIPYRKLNESIQIEKELKKCGLKIEYLYYHHELSFDVYPDYPNFDYDHLPKTLRICTTLA